MTNALLLRRLDNWARAMRWRAQTGTRCRSLEGHYRSPQCWTETTHAPTYPLDLRDAERVELAWRKLNALDRMVLKGHYVVKAEPATVCRLVSRLLRLRLSYRSYPQALAHAEEAIAKNLDTKMPTAYFRVKLVLAAQA